jgi:GTPase
MANQNFIDRIRIYCRSGSGGSGSVHFHRDKFTKKGGPDGGDGGRGAHIMLRGNRNLWTLFHLRYQKHVIAENGKPGSANLKTGADGKDLIIDVPLGTIASEEISGEKLVEITADGEKCILLPGGMGGKGNAFFKSSTRQAPDYAQSGISGKEAHVIMELKLLADVGLLGFPNAGKSTLLSTISAAKPKIADYPFTTLVPGVGVVPYRDNRSFVVADIPGIIEGAHEGKGLGTRFLRHVERNSVLLICISVESLDIQKEYDTLINEMQKFNPQLLHKRRILALCKSDMLDEELISSIEQKMPDIPYIFISSVSGLHIQELKDLIWNTLVSGLE